MTFLVTIILTLFFLLICFIGMGVGLIFKGRKMKGGCGSTPVNHNEKSSCEYCSEKRKLNLCSSSDSPEISKISKINTLTRFKDRTH